MGHMYDDGLLLLLQSSLIPLVEGLFAQEGLSCLFMHATDITLMRRSTITVRPVGVCMT